MIEPRRQKNGIILPTFVLPPNATIDGKYPTKVLGCKLTALGKAAQR